MNALKKGVKIRPIFSIIIPCYNSTKTIERLLDSIVDQNFPSVEVIIQDDYSNDDFMDLVEPYKDKLNIKYFRNKMRTIHCPGNTRRDGLKHATGHWVAFIDHDDMFEPNILLEVLNCINTKAEKHLVVSNFREYHIDEEDPSKNWYGKSYIYSSNSTWLHGKFYNLDFLRNNNITFQEDFESNEDLLFNQTIFCRLLGKGMGYSILNINTYKWVYNDDSISRKMYKTGEFYIDKYFYDYAYASTEPWYNLVELYPEQTETIYRKITFTSLALYFYYQSLYYRKGRKHDRKNRDIFEDFITRIRTTFDVTNQDIVNTIYSDPKVYNQTRETCTGGAGLIVESESFATFMSHF